MIPISVMGTKETRERQQSMDKIYVHGVIQGLSQARDMAIRREGWSALGIAMEIDRMLEKMNKKGTK